MQTPQNKELIIDVQTVYKSFKQVKAVNGVDLQVHLGQFLALLGPNGAGKTTLVEMIEGIQKPDSGKIFIKGKTWRGHAESLHRIIGLSLQETRVIDKYLDHLFLAAEKLCYLMVLGDHADKRNIRGSF